jgi:hypothetical protein
MLSLDMCVLLQVHTLMLMFLCCRMPCSRSSLFLLGALADAVGGLRSGSLRLGGSIGGQQRQQ